MVLCARFWNRSSLCILSEVNKGMFYYTIVVKKNIYIMGEILFKMKKWKHFWWTNHLPMKKVAPIGNLLLTILLDFRRPNWQLLTRAIGPWIYVMGEINKIWRRRKSEINVRILLWLQEICTNTSQDYGIPLVFKAYINKPYTIPNEWLVRIEKKP